MSEEQRAVCEKYGSACVEAEANEIVGLAVETLDKVPLYGVRIMPTQGTTGWYIWGGPHSTSTSFYQPIHLSHLKDLCPSVIKYLGLEPGFKFIIDHNGFEDVWREDAAGTDPSTGSG